MWSIHPIWNLSILIIINPNRIEIDGSKRSFLFKAYNKEVAMEWVDNIRLHIEESKLNLKKLSVTSATKYWKVIFEFDTI